jgi:hypothetical protein
MMIDVVIVFSQGTACDAVSYGSGTQHGTKTGHDRHESSATCTATDSVRVYHVRGVPVWH